MPVSRKHTISLLRTLSLSDTYLFFSESESDSYVTTDGQSASLSWHKAPIWGFRPDFCYCQTVAGALSDERTGLSFTIAAGPRQGSNFRFLIPWNLWPYFTLSDSRLPFSSPLTAHRATVEVFEPASRWDTPLRMNSYVYLADRIRSS
jgi:hypothetical protein